MKTHVIILLSLLLVLPMISADQEAAIICGGDNELQIYCLGDNQNLDNFYKPTVIPPSGGLTGSGGLYNISTNKTIEFNQTTVTVVVGHKTYKINIFLILFYISIFVMFLILLIIIIRSRKKKE